MREVLDPLEIGDGDAAGVEVEIGDDGDPSVAQDEIGFGRGWRVGGFGDQRGLDAVGVAGGELVLQRGGDEDVAGLLERLQRVGEDLAGGEVADPAMFPALFGDRFHVEAVGVVEAGVVLGDADDPRAVVGEFPRRVIADVAQALHDHAFAFESGREAVSGVGVGEAVDDAVEDAQSGRLAPARDAVQRERLAGDAAEVVDVVRVERAVGVDDPGHLALAGAVVGRRDIDGRADEAVSVEFDHQAARDALNKLGRALVGVDADAALGSAEGDIDDGALEGHQRGETLDFVAVDHRRVADAALGRQAVMAVLGAPGLDHLDLPVLVFDREGHLVEVVAGLDLLKQARVQVRVLGSRFEILGEVVIEVGHRALATSRRRARRR